MSLADLPDVLIAHLTSYLEYEDVCNLMETSKKNYNAIKAYKKDKINVDTMRFGQPGYDVNFEAFVNSKDGLTIKALSSKYIDDYNTSEETILEVLDKCSSVEMIEFFAFGLTSEFSKFLFELKDKVRKVSMKWGPIAVNGKEFAKFCQQFRGSVFTTHCFWYSADIWTDDALVPVIEASTSIYMFDGEVEETAKLITDRTLKALFSGNSHPTCFEMAVFHNSFTIKELVKSVKILKESKSKTLSYHLGFLQSDQLNDAEHYFNKETGELKNEFHVGGFDSGRYNSYYVVVGLRGDTNNKDEKAGTARILFEVLH